MMSKSILCCGGLAMLLASSLAAGDKKGVAGDATKGKEVFEQNCTVCHNIDSPEKKVGPSLQGLYKRDKLKNGKKMTDDNVKAIVNAGGNGMPAYADTITEEEKNNVIAYLKTL